jgi:very-short-patch-repair endonuclease
MGQLSTFDKAALERFIARQHGVVSRRQIYACAMTDSALRHRIRPGGPWQTVLPGVFLASTGEMTARQRAAAAYLYAGPGIAVTGLAALAWHRLSAEPGAEVDVLVELGCLRRSVGFARLHRTGIEPNVAIQDGMVTYAPPARAIADAARQLADAADVRAIVAAAVQRGKVHIWQLAEELAQGPVRGSAGLRGALAEVAEGVRSAAEADLLRLIRRARLPVPLLNPRLYMGGKFLASPDAWWPDAGVAVEVDSRQWHLAPAEWEETMARHARMSSRGIIVLHYSPRRIRSEGTQVAAEIRAALAAGRSRSLPPVTAIPA